MERRRCLARLVLVWCVWGLMLPLAVGQAQQPAEVSPSAQEPGKRATLLDIVRTIEQLEHDRAARQEELRSPQAEGRQEEITKQIQVIGDKLRQLKANLNEIASGVNPDLFATRREETAFDWQQKLGSSQRTVSTSQFMTQSPTVLSTGFRLQILFGLDYQHQAEVTRDIPAQLAARIEKDLIREGYQDNIVRIAVEFEEAGASALNVRVLADFAGAAAPSFYILRRALQRICVETCNDCGWVIPFTQVTLHMASAADHRAPPALDGVSTQEDR